MNLKNKKSNKERMESYKKIILEILDKYELFESYIILSGLELVGTENTLFWLQFVKYVKNKEGFGQIEKYFYLMQQLPREELLNFLEKTKVLSFEEVYSIFIDLLFQVARIEEIERKTK